MKKNITLPADFYQQLYDFLDNYYFEPNNVNDICEIEGIEIGDFTVSLDAEYEIEEDDEDFWSERHFYAEDLLNIDNVVIYYNGDDEDIDVSHLFNPQVFWNQFKRYGAKVNGVQIHHGDEVVAKCSNNFGRWEKVIYLYTDNRLGVHVCAKSLGRNSIKRNYHLLLPATTGALSIVGKVDYRFRDKA